MSDKIIAVCGKGGVGKTSISAMFARTFIEDGIRPLLLVDADPAGGLTIVIGDKATNSLASVRDQLIHSARVGEATKIVKHLDYLLLESIEERKDYSLLAIGHSSEKGCFCPANQLLKKSIDVLASAFKIVLIDAEAGIEQINRKVTQKVDHVITIIDGSRQSFVTAELIREKVESASIYYVLNRSIPKDMNKLPENMKLIGVIPENANLRKFNREGKSLFNLPENNEALIAVRRIARAIIRN